MFQTAVIFALFGACISVPLAPVSWLPSPMPLRTNSELCGKQVIAAPWGLLQSDSYGKTIPPFGSTHSSYANYEDSIFLDGQHQLREPFYGENVQNKAFVGEVVPMNDVTYVESIPRYGGNNVQYMTSRNNYFLRHPMIQDPSITPYQNTPFVLNNQKFLTPSQNRYSTMMKTGSLARVTGSRLSFGNSPHYSYFLPEQRKPEYFTFRFGHEQDFPLSNIVQSPANAFMPQIYKTIPFETTSYDAVHQPGHAGIASVMGVHPNVLVQKQTSQL